MNERHRWGDAPEHDILPDARSYSIVAFHLERDLEGGSEPFLDLTLRRGAERRILRFWSPRDLEIERGGPTYTGGLQISDISSQGLEDLTVRVWDCEGSRGAVSFVAKRVENLSKEPEYSQESFTSVHQRTGPFPR